MAHQNLCYTTRTWGTVASECFLFVCKETVIQNATGRNMLLCMRESIRTQHLLNCLSTFCASQSRRLKLIFISKCYFQDAHILRIPNSIGLSGMQIELRFQLEHLQKPASLSALTHTSPSSIGLSGMQIELRFGTLAEAGQPELQSLFCLARNYAASVSPAHDQTMQQVSVRPELQSLLCLARNSNWRGATKLMPPS